MDPMQSTKRYIVNDLICFAVAFAIQVGMAIGACALVAIWIAAEVI